MEISTNLINFIKKFEGYSSHAYICLAGKKTIGYGHVLKEKENIETISEEKAEELLYDDINKASCSVIRNISAKLTQGQFVALTSFTFNLGAASLQRSTLRQKVNRNEHSQVPSELMRWVYSCGKVIPGLVRRREEESNIYMS